MNPTFSSFKIFFSVAAQYMANSTLKADRQSSLEGAALKKNNSWETPGPVLQPLEIYMIQDSTGGFTVWMCRIKSANTSGSLALQVERITMKKAEKIITEKAVLWSTELGCNLHTHHMAELETWSGAGFYLQAPSLSQRPGHITEWFGLEEP